MLWRSYFLCFYYRKSKGISTMMTDSGGETTNKRAPKESETSYSVDEAKNANATATMTGTVRPREAGM